MLEATDVENIRARDAAAAQDALQAQTVAEQLARRKPLSRQAAAEEAGAKAEAKRSHAGEEAQEKIAKANDAAEKIAADHPQNRLVCRSERRDRPSQGDGAMRQARKALMYPRRFPRVTLGTPRCVKLREAKDLLAPIKKHLGETVRTSLDVSSTASI